MQIQVNGEAFEITQNANLSALVALQDLQGKRIAIEVNGELVTRSQYDAFRLNENDTVEIVQAIGGG